MPTASRVPNLHTYLKECLGDVLSCLWESQSVQFSCAELQRPSYPYLSPINLQTYFSVDNSYYNLNYYTFLTSTMLKRMWDSTILNPNGVLVCVLVMLVLNCSSAERDYNNCRGGGGHLHCLTLARSPSLSRTRSLNRLMLRKPACTELPKFEEGLYKFLTSSFGKIKMRRPPETRQRLGFFTFIARQREKRPLLNSSLHITKHNSNFHQSHSALFTVREKK